MTLPNLAGVASKDLVEKIGTGKFSAAYINWSRTMNLLRTNAPGWLVDYVASEDGSLLHRAPVGAYLLIRFVNVESGALTPALPQAVMDHRNNAIPYDKITARDITDTQRRGMCMAAAMHFGLAYELWAKLPLESGYGHSDSDTPVEVPKSSVPGKAPSAEAAKVSETTFRESALEQGIHTTAIDILVGITKEKLGGDFGKGLGILASKSAEEINKKYATDEKSTESEGQW